MPNKPASLYFLVPLSFAFAACAISARAGTACVWRVTNVPVPFYLVGTVHALSGNDYPLSKPYTQALNDSHRLLFEMDPSPKSDFDVSSKFCKERVTRSSSYK